MQTEIKRKRRIFVSYAHDEFAPEVEQVCRDLASRGHELWFDRSNIGIGDRWDADIQKGIQWVTEAGHHGCLLYFLTPKSASDTCFCLNELKEAQDNALTIYPILVVKGVKHPIIINIIDHLDMAACFPSSLHQAEYQDKFEVLTRQLEGDVHSESKLGGFRQVESAHGSLFLDRKEILEDAHYSLLDINNRLLVIYGPLLVGKTELCKRLVGKLENEPSIDIRSRERILTVNGLQLKDQPGTLLRSYLPVFLPEAAREKFQQQWDDENLDVEVKVNDLLNSLVDHDYLLVIDNMHCLLDANGEVTSNKLRTFFSVFAENTAHRLKIIGISRIKPIIHSPYTFSTYEKLAEGLPEEDALTLLKTKLGDVVQRIDEKMLHTIIQRINGFPGLINILSTIIEQYPRHDLHKLLDEDFLKDEDALSTMKKFHSLLSEREKQVLLAVSIFERPEPVAALTGLLPSDFSHEDLEDVLFSLEKRFYLQYREEKYYVDLVNREFIQMDAPLDGQFCLCNLHTLAANYYLDQIASYENTGEAAGHYMNWYRHENNEWQETICEWLSHLANAGNETQAYRQIALQYFNAFWWWAGYIPFVFCENLLALIHETKPLRKNPQFLDLLNTFHHAWPLESEYRTRADETARWQKVNESVLQLRELLGCGGGLQGVMADPTMRQLRALTDFVLGQAGLYLHNGEGAGYFEESLQIASDEPCLDWSICWIHYHLSRIAQAENRTQEALDHVRKAWQTADKCDHEVIANILRQAGEIQFQMGKDKEGWKNCLAAAYCAFRFQADPRPADEYTITFYNEVINTLLDRLLAEYVRDKETALTTALDFHDFWREYREDAGKSILTRPDLAEMIDSNDRPTLLEALFPESPKKEMSSEYTASVEKFICRKRFEYSLQV
jgi:hypothetical protein